MRKSVFQQIKSLDLTKDKVSVYTSKQRLVRWSRHQRTTMVKMINKKRKFSFLIFIVSFNCWSICQVNASWSLNLKCSIRPLSEKEIMGFWSKALLSQDLGGVSELWPMSITAISYGLNGKNPNIWKSYPTVNSKRKLNRLNWNNQTL